MHYPSVAQNQSRGPEEIEVGVSVVGAVRIRCLLDPDWVSVLCFRVSPNEPSQYLGVVTGVETDTPGLHLVDQHRWRFPTPELRQALRRRVIDLYRTWKQAR
ncbi:hypothetical protein GCM10027447_16050 [Glycomyces halotolerans]